MYIDESVLREYLEDEGKFLELCRRKKEIVKWWLKTNSILEKSTNVEEVQYYMFEGQKGNGREDLDSFLKQQQSKEEREKFENYLFLLGGVEIVNNRFVIDPRLMKIASGNDDFLNDIHAAISKKNTYNLLTNNHPNNLFFLMQSSDFKEKQSFEKSKLVFSHPWNILNRQYKDCKGLRQDVKTKQIEEFEEQNKIKLETRFPLKFLWMWMNPDVIHPLSLMAFREFLKSDFMEQILSGIAKNAKDIAMEDIETFSKDWKEISREVEGRFSQNNKEIMIENKSITGRQKISLLISLLTLGETEIVDIKELLETQGQIILYGVPGTGKTHSAKELVGKWSGENIQDFSQLKKWQFSEIVKEKHDLDCKQQGCKICNSPIVWEIMQFHPNTTYQDFIGGIAPKTDNKGALSYELKNGKFKNFCEYANKYGIKKDGKERPFVFIIDEINRANLSEVLGELLYALEYRDGGITIPNFDEPFVIPSNVYIIGTMNNVDKSLSAFDLALRRRFGFYEIGVDCDVVGKMVEKKTREIKNINLYIGRCEDLNALLCGEIDEEDQSRLEKEWVLGLEPHYKIGQAYFAKIKDFLAKNEQTIKTPHLEKIWSYHIQPLIEEYIGFSMSNQEISNKLDNLKAFWIRELK